MPELESNHIIPAMEEFPKGLGYFRRDKNRYELVNGSMIHFSHCQYEKDVYQYQGAEIHILCVAAGTEVLMGDGSYKAIESLCEGDMAMTLRGARRVTRAFGARLVECVSIRTPYGTQINPADHKVLALDGWISYRSLVATAIQRHDQNRSGGQGCDRSPVCRQAHGSLALDHAQSGALSRSFQGHQQNVAMCAWSADGENDCVGSYGGPQEGLSFRARLVSPLSQIRLAALAKDHHDACGEGELKFLLPAQHHDEPLRQPTEGDTPPLAPQQDDAGAQDHHVAVRQDDRADAQEYSHQGRSRFRHPYTMAAQVAVVPLDEASCSITPVGEREVYDISIDDQHHYITRCGLVNQNCIDELTTFSPLMIDYLRSRVRCALDIPAKWKHKVPGIYCASNPGGVSHLYCKRRWVDFAAPNECKYAPQNEGGMLRQYIPALLHDNPSLAVKDPRYIHRLEALPEPLRTAYKEGRWDLFMGQFFNFNHYDHVIKPISVPPTVALYMTFDWGFGAPFSIGWWWVDADGRLYRFTELYGQLKGQPNKGSRISDAKIAAQIKRKEIELGIAGRPILRIADPTCWNKKPDYRGGGQGPSTAEEFADLGLVLVKGDANRKLKWRQMHKRLETPERPPVDPGEEELPREMPMLVVYDTCEHFIRTIPALQADPHDPEDVDDRLEDHVADDTALICMARPLAIALPSTPDLVEMGALT